MKWEEITQEKSRVFLFSLISFAVGVALGEILAVDVFFIFCLILVFILLLIFFCSNKRIRPIIFWVVFLLIGFWRFEINLPDFNNPGKIYFYNNQTVEFVGVIKKLERRVERQKLTIEADSLSKGKIKGLVLINTNLYPEFFYGDEIKVNCKLEKPGQIEDFDYERYLSRYHIYSLCRSTKIEKVGYNRGHFLMSLILQFKNLILRRLDLSVKEPEVSILEAMVLGDQWKIPRSILDEFSNVSLSHVIAISGMNITIVAQVLMILAINFGLIRQKAFWVAVFGLIFYIVIIGFPASAVRAVIMAVLFLYAQKIGRKSQALNAMILVAALMILFNPKVLLYDVSFQMSFLAIFGLIYLVPILEKYFQKLPDFWQIKEMVIVTLAAQIMTLPIIIFYFQKLSLIAVLANLLVLPIVSFLTIWGLVNVLASLLFVGLGRLVGFVSWFFINYMIKVAHYLSQIPLAYLSLPKLNIFVLIGLYMLIGWWIYREKKKL